MPIISNFPSGGSHSGRIDNPHKVTKAQVGLSNVDNTADKDKPVSSVQATAIADAKNAGTTALNFARNHAQNKVNPHAVTAAQVGAATSAALNAHTGNRSNPHGVTAGQIGAATTSALSSHTSNKSNPHGVTRAQIDAAPNGFGLGSAGGARILNFSSDLNNLKQNGWYAKGSSDTVANCPAQYASVFVDARDSSHIVQYCYDYVQKNIQSRVCSGGTWGAWEYLNPYVSPNVEYRTMERYWGLPVYTKMVRFTGIPKNTEKIVAHGAKASRMLRIAAQRGANGTLPMRYGNIEIAIYADRQNIHVYSYNLNNALTDEVFVQLWYTKD